jgi:hypothetical protein
MPPAMHPPPHAPPPMPFEEFGAWHGFNQFGPRPNAGFGARMPFHCEERRLSPPRPKPKHKLQLLEIEPSGRPEVCALISFSLDCSDKGITSVLLQKFFFQIRHKNYYLDQIFLLYICSVLS